MNFWWFKRNQKLLSLIFILFLAQGLQLGFINPILSIDEYRPNLLLILTAFVGFRFGHISGSSFGFFSGLLQDLMSGFLGLYALCKTLTGYFAFYFSNRHILVIERVYFPLVVLLLSLGHDALYYALYSLDSSLSFRALFLNATIENALYNAVLSFIVMMILPRRFLDTLQTGQR